MGLFGSKKKTSVGTSINRVIDTKNIPNSPKIGAIKGILENGEIVDYIVDELLNSVGVKSDRLYEYANKNYPIGVPTKTFQYRSKGLAQVQAILNAQHGKAVAIEYSRFGPPNLTHIAWMKLIKDWKYDPNTNEVVGKSTTGKKQYLDYVTMVIPSSRQSEYESGALEQWGKSPSSGYKPWEPYNQDLPSVIPQQPVMLANIPDEKLKIGIGYLDKKPMNSQAVLSSFDISTAGYKDDGSYFHVKYKVDNKVYYWMYEQGIGTYPTLDNLFDNNAKLGSFYPNIYLRYDKKPMNQDKASATYKTSTKMCKYLGLNYEQMIEMVHENPDIADVEQGFLTFAIPANTTDPVERKYLFAFFKEMFNTVGDIEPSASPQGRWGTQAFNDVKNAVVIQDSLFKMALNSSGLQFFHQSGVVAKVGEYDSGFAYQQFDSFFQSETGNKIPTKVNVDYHYYRKQISDNIYEEVRVYNMKMVYYIWGGYNTTADDTSNLLLVPLDKSIVDLYTIPEKEQLVSRSIHFVFNSRVVTKLKWYQTGFFKAFMFIAAIVITIFTYGSTWASMGAALAAGGTAAVVAIQAALIGVLKSIVFAYGFKLFVKEVGPEFALLLAIVTVAYGGYKYLSDGKSLFAENLLMVGNGLNKAVEGYYADALQGLQREAEMFKSEAERLNDQLSKASDELMGSVTALSPFVVFGESPNDFYNRTVHSGNIGAQSIAAVSNFVDVALQLPKFNDSI